jgi:hypothetical protein
MKTRKPKKVKANPTFKLDDYYTVVDRVMYRGNEVATCDSRRRLQDIVDFEREPVKIYDELVDMLMTESNDERSKLLSEIVGIWVLTEYGAMLPK